MITFNDYFSCIGAKLANEIPNKSQMLNNFIDQPVSQSIFLKPVEETEIFNEIRKLKIGKAPGLDGITTKLLKSISYDIMPLLEHLINLSLSTGTYPKSLKEQKLFRQINLLSILEK